jgi:Glycosyl transferase family 2
MSAPLLSVTLLNHNYAHFLDHCLQSILRQSFTDFELIVVDDRSTDNSVEVIRPYLTDPRVRLVRHEQNRGFVQSLIEATESSDSRYLTVISADDLVLSDRAFEQQIQLLESNSNTAFCYATWQYIDARNRAVSTVRPWSHDHVWTGEREFRSFCTRFYVLHTGTIVRRSAYTACGGYDASIRYTLDNTLWAQLCGQGDVAYVAETLYGYRTHGSNMSHNPAAVHATVDEFVRLVDIGFAGLPATSATRYDSALRRRSRQAALLGVATMLVFGGLRRAGWAAFFYAARRSPLETVLQRRTLSLLVRTAVPAGLFDVLRRCVRSISRPASVRRRGLPSAEPRVSS